MAKEYKFKCKGCATTEQGMKKLKSDIYKIEQVDEGEDNIIAFTEVKNPFLVRFFGILHEEEGGIYITGVFETGAFLKIFISVAVFVIIGLFVGAGVIQRDFILEQLVRVYPPNTHLVRLIVAKYGAYCVSALTAFALVMYTLWLSQSSQRKKMIEEIERIMGSKCTVS